MAKLDGLAALAADQKQRDRAWGAVAADTEEKATLPIREDAIPWPAPMAPEAFYGLAGDVVRGVSPYTEADDAALLVNLLVSVGNMVGAGPYFMAGEDKHQLKINAALVGESGKGRKGSS